MSDIDTIFSTLQPSLTQEEAQWVYDTLSDSSSSSSSTPTLPTTEEGILSWAEERIRGSFGKSGVPFRSHRLIPVSSYTEASQKVEYVIEVGVEEATRAIAPMMSSMFFGIALVQPTDTSLHIQLRFHTMLGVPMIYEYIFSSEKSVRQKIKGIFVYLVFLKTIIHTYNLYEALRTALPERVRVELQIPHRPITRMTIDQPWFFLFHRESGVKRCQVHMVRHLRREKIYLEAGTGALWLTEDTPFSEKFHTLYQYAILL